MNISLSLMKLLFPIPNFFQAEDGIRDAAQSRGLGDVYKRQDEDSTKSFKDSLFNALNLFNNHEWYEAHDAFEEIWNSVDGDELSLIHI